PRLLLLPCTTLFRSGRAEPERVTALPGAPKRGRVVDTVRRCCARSGAPGPPVSVRPRRTGERHPPRTGAEARLPTAEAGLGRSRSEEHTSELQSPDH